MKPLSTSLILAAVLAVGTLTASAQTNTPSLSGSTPTTAPVPPPGAPAPPGSPGEVNHHLDKLAEKLGLTPAQKAQIRPILVTAAEKRKAIHDDTALTEDQKKAQFKALHESTKSQIEAILTPAQKQQFEAMREHHPAGAPGQPTPPPQE